jgi:hypothetical protein
MFESSLTKKIAGFLSEIGLEIAPRRLEAETFLPGILIESGKIFVDEERLAYPGDLLHEAGHLAVIPGDLRDRLSDEVELPGFDPPTIEAAALAWSYAAALHLEIDPKIVFHREGYLGKADALLRNFELGVYVGVHVLENAVMTKTGENARNAGVAPYPKMLKWLRD